MNLLLKLSRIKDWFHILGIPILGYFMVSGATIEHLSFLKMLIFASSSLAFAYMFNDYSDLKYRSSSLLIYSGVFAIVSITVAFLISTQALSLAFLGLLTSFLYSFHLVRLKNIPFVSVSSNSLALSILFLVGSSSFGGVSTEALLFVPVIFMITVSFNIMHEIDHADMDKMSGTRTTAIVIGSNMSLMMSHVFITLPFFWLFAVNIFFGAYGQILPLHLMLLIVYFMLVSRVRAIGKLRMYMRYTVIVYGLATLYTLVI
ncbi:MAG: UbiA prenyltransferase family protein [Candidatus Aenigmarchaeota archaeon]|nr:UbiA prenyltransferase family protein [Candidatus Aenigmarchaeota archaeon]